MELGLGSLKIELGWKSYPSDGCFHRFLKMEILPGARKDFKNRDVLVQDHPSGAGPEPFCFNSGLFRFMDSFSKEIRFCRFSSPKIAFFQSGPKRQNQVLGSL